MRDISSSSIVSFIAICIIAIVMSAAIFALIFSAFSYLHLS